MVGDLYSSMIVDEWEKASNRVSEAGIRVVNLRFGMVLSPLGGALKKFVFPAKMCAGGKLGNGKNLISWISMEDVLGVVTHSIRNENVSGPINVVANDMYSNKGLIKTICNPGDEVIIPSLTLFTQILSSVNSSPFLISLIAVTQIFRPLPLLILKIMDLI